MTTYKHVAGIGNVAMTPEEEAAWLAESEANDPVLHPPPGPEPHLNYGGLARFSGAAPIVVYESIRMAGVTRVSKGRYRVLHEEAMPSDQYSVFASVLDANPRNIRVTARTTAYVEVRVTDNANAVQDPTEVSVKTERVVTP